MLQTSSLTNPRFRPKLVNDSPSIRVPSKFNRSDECDFAWAIMKRLLHRLRILSRSELSPCPAAPKGAALRECPTWHAPSLLFSRSLAMPKTLRKPRNSHQAVASSPPLGRFNIDEKHSELYRKSTISDLITNSNLNTVSEQRWARGRRNLKNAPRPVSILHCPTSLGPKN